MANSILFHEQGPASVMRLETTEPGTPNTGEVRLQQTAVGVNYLDIYVRRGDFGHGALPGDTGFEAAGVIEEVGEGVDWLSPGDRVAYQLVKGAYADARVMPADRLVKLPDDISDETAASVMLKGMTAEYLLRRFRRIQPSQTILVHAASGGVGSILTQWAHHLGATVIGTVGTKAKAEVALQRGVDHAILYTEEDFAAKVMEITNGRGVDIAYDGVGKATFGKNFDCLAPFGTNALFGWSSGKVDPVDVHMLNGKSHEVGNPSLGHYTGTRAQIDESAVALFEVIRSGAVRVDVNHRYALAEAARAHEDLEARRTSGSILLLPEPA